MTDSFESKAREIEARLPLPADEHIRDIATALRDAIREERERKINIATIINVLDTFNVKTNNVGDAALRVELAKAISQAIREAE
ncbi:unnamed protein product [marine sediment metagenome]|uniref:Uncharacterized protein n=1 Tax=marine sediment metagenome TaxID=412755 RepID=X0VA44_9ZZZZ